MKNRVWELDALRGVCVIGMIVVHFVFDLVSLYGLVRWEYNSLFSFIMNWGGVLFLLISGICATLGSRSVRRGLIVFGCGLIVTAVTAGMYLLGIAHESIIIYFGVLHCLGICMMLWYFLKKLPTWALGLLGAALAITGLLIRDLRVESPYLFWIGLTTETFATADFFPLLPYLGFFLLGAFLGRTLYREKTTLFPKADPGHPIIRLFTACGRHSLIIYLLHQPVLSLIIIVLAKISDF
ncbi:MAG: DUF1624 domain-containing protein [Oscillospiraceae bacterium]|nr:DUF1624 domain-containing protein [Oscillospiraceae bacterium]